MARKKKKPQSIKEVGGRMEIKRLWRTIPPPEWLQLFHELAPENRWEMEGLHSIKGCCPYHEDANPSFHLNFMKGMGKCFGDTCEKVVVDLVNLVAKLRHCSYTEALMFLNDRFQIGDKLLSNADELNKYNNIQELKKQVAMASNKVLIEVLRDNPDHLDYVRPALVYLIESRKLPAETLHTLPVGVYAKPEHLKKHIANGQLHPLFDEYFAKYQSTVYWGALMFYYNDSPGSITRFKLRLRNNDLPKEKPTFENLRKLDGPAKRRLFGRDFAYIEDPYTDQLGVFGLFKYQRMVGRNDANAYITEGEFDVLSVMAAQDMRFSAEFMILGTGGKGGTNIGFLREFGVRTCWLIPDHPTKNGDDWALSLLRDRHNFLAMGDFKGLEMRIFQWPVRLIGDDLDEVVHQNGYEEMVDYLVRGRNAHFLDELGWIISRCEQELANVKSKYDSELETLDLEDGDVANQRENLINAKHRAIGDLLLKWYHCLHNNSDKLRFTQKYAAQEGVDLAQIEDIHHQINGLDTFEGVVNAVVEALEQYFSIAYYEGRGSSLTATLWSKTHGDAVDIILDEKKLFQQLALYLGMPVTTWLDKMLGHNDIYLEGTEGVSGLKAQKIRKANAMLILQSAFEVLVSKLVKRENLTARDQGIHFSDLPVLIQNAGIVYFVNGKYVFKGRFTEPGLMEWERVNSMVDKVNNIGVLFTGLLDSSTWSHVTDVSDLYAATQVDLKDVFQKIRTLLSGWKFEHHDVIEPYLAAYIMSLPIMCAVGNINVTLITGDKESGKTSLACGLLGGMKEAASDQVQSILEPAIAMTDTTGAAMYQNFDLTTLTFVLDEAENNSGDQKRDERNREVARLTYGMPMGAVRVSRGATTKDGRVNYIMRMPVIMAAINIPTDSTFLSRVMIISTVKEEGRQNLQDYISDRFSDAEIEDLRKAVTIGLIPHIPQLMKIRTRLRKDLPEIGRAVAHISNRFINSILTPLAVYELIGFNAGQLYIEILKRYKNRLESIHGQDAQSNLINTCLYKKRIKVPTQDMISDFVSAKQLILDGEFNTLNSSDCGVYYLAEDDWIVIVWRQVKYTLLQGTSYERAEESAMKEQAAKNPYVIPEITPQQHERIQYYLRLSDVKSAADYSVIRSGYLVKTAAVREAAKPKARIEKPVAVKEEQLFEQAVEHKPDQDPEPYNPKNFLF